MRVTIAVVTQEEMIAVKAKQASIVDTLLQQ